MDRVRGRASFALSTLQEVLELEPVTVKVSIDDGPNAQHRIAITRAGRKAEAEPTTPAPKPAATKKP